MTPEVIATIFIESGWTVLLGWACLQGVKNGKDIVEIKTIVKNGLASNVEELKSKLEVVEQLKRKLETHMVDEEQLLSVALRRDPELRTRAEDRELGVAARRRKRSGGAG